MRAPIGLVAALLPALVFGPVPAHAQTPPHQFLFGVWTGGLFPVVPGALAQACATPTFIVARDVVQRSSLTETGMAQRIIETVRTIPKGAEFRFAPGGLGFGCESPDVLHVERVNDNEITFPGCHDFPEPLVRCR